MKIKIEDIVKYYKKEKVSRLKYYNALSKKEIKESKKTIEPFYEKMKTGLFVMEGKNIIAHNMLINLFMFSLKVPNLTTIGSVLIENSVNINLSHLLKDKDFEIDLDRQLIYGRSLIPENPLLFPDQYFVNVQYQNELVRSFLADKDKEKFLKMGMDGYIPKPIDNDELYSVLKEFLL